MTRQFGRSRALFGWLESAALGGLLVVIATVGLVGLGLNSQVRRITDQALSYDIELEDRSDDFRVAVLDMRHYHRNIAFVGPTRRGLVDYDAAYLQLQAQIGRLEEIGMADANVTSPEALREIVETYYEAFRPAIELYNSDRQAFALASDAGLERIAELEGLARELDQLGEQRAADALRRVEAAENSARVVLLTVLFGLGLVGAGLVYLITVNNQEKQRAAAELSRALQLRNRFIADASHELRTPLTVLRANAEIGLQLEQGCVHIELLEEIVAESERMTRLVEDLLFLARSDSDAVPLEMEMVDVETFFAQVGHRARSLAQQREVKVALELAAEGAIFADRTRIEQLVLILVDNAIKYGASDRPVTLRTRSRFGELVVEVVDHGAGIAASELSLIFERFYRADKARSRSLGGTGLGLSIARSIVEGHEGRIVAESVVGKGTTIRFFLPLVELDKAQLPA